MGLKSVLSKPLAAFIFRRTQRWAARPIETQTKIFNSLLAQGRSTAFGKDHHFDQITSYGEFCENVPVSDYEGFRPYIEKIKKGESNILWPGKPLYLSKTSGTTSGVKYIPITKESIPFHIAAARDALLLYIHRTGNSAFTDKKMIFFSGSPELDHSGPIPTGRLSGIVNHYVPGYLRKNQMPLYKTNCIDDWENKIEAIVEETKDADMSLFSGIPPWVQMYFDKLLEKTGQKPANLFPSLQLFVYGGVNYEPYRLKIEESIGKKVDSIELYPASEGFIALQDGPEGQGLLLLLNSGMFYEFIPVSEYFNENRKAITLKDVEPGINYALILTTNAGLWRYDIGDTIKFVSISPYRIVVSGRVKHFLSAFGEHLIVEEAEKALQNCLKNQSVKVVEFTVAPQITPKQGLPYHEWFIEFDGEEPPLEALALKLDEEVRKLNIYYHDLIAGSVLQPLKISLVRKGGFIEYMKKEGKLGGQNKVPRLSNDRRIADVLTFFTKNI